jgi:cell fate (sporulation/competence/biofilm development) regulator YlbF (YheA/YmcA/DUF963 family)
MADRKTEIVEAMSVLLKRARELASEYDKVTEEYQQLKAELEAIKQDEAATKSGFS